LEEKEEWIKKLVLAIQLNDNSNRALISLVENLRDEANLKYDLGKRAAEMKFQEKLDEAHGVNRQLKALQKTVETLKSEKETWVVHNKRNDIHIRELQKTVKNLENETNFLEDFNNQLFETIKKQEKENNTLEEKVKILSKDNDNLRKENIIYEKRLNKLSKRIQVISKRFTDFNEGKVREIEEKVNELKTNQEILLPKKKKKRKKKTEV